jgi:hypothetical protein
VIRKLFIPALILLFASTATIGQPPAGFIGVYSDVGGGDFTLDDCCPGLMNTYIVHSHTMATGCRFWAPKPACMDAIYLTESSPYPSSGNSQTGIIVSYGQCLSAPIHVLTISWLALGTTPNCCCYFIFPDPTADPPGIYVSDCSDPSQLLLGNSYIAIINQNAECGEHTIPDTCINYPVPVENSTWGSIKSLYRN